MACLQDAAPFLAVANVSDFKYLLADRSHQCMDAIQSAQCMNLPFAQSNSFWFFFVEDLSISQSKCCSLSSNDSFFVAVTTLRIPPIKQVKTCLFDLRTHLSSSSDAVTRAFTLLNTCASSRTVCGGGGPNMLAYFVRPDQILTRTVYFVTALINLCMQSQVFNKQKSTQRTECSL